MVTLKLFKPFKEKKNKDLFLYIYFAELYGEAKHKNTLLLKLY